MPKKSKMSLRDFAEQIGVTGVAYTHLVRNSMGGQFSIHKSELAAQTVADRIGGTVETYLPVQSHYWDGTLGSRYDH